MLAARYCNAFTIAVTRVAASRCEDRSKAPRIIALRSFGEKRRPGSIPLIMQSALSGGSCQEAAHFEETSAASEQTY